ncbi:LTA synthase family protein [uncultured Maribacter sp.]|uniref:LTA synthase family protein n=1 Tax=uncultured Maribacter sp. TaxID=431308 RepID=UPI00261662FA|nr:LTA synthase family protein [uncultured Maribacter sp.]
MQIKQDIPKNSTPKKLKDFIPLVLTFFGALVLLSLYQNLSLYLSGVLDTVINKSFFLLLLNHTGYVAITALFLSFIFNFLENKKPGKGYITVKFILILLVIIEALLIQYYVLNYEILGTEILSLSKSDTVLFSVTPIIGLLLLCLGISFYIHKVTAKTYGIISRMYPFTIILFSLFLATLYATKKPINENKTTHLFVSLKDYILEDDTYEGSLEYPMLKNDLPKDVLSPLFNTASKKPNFLFIIIDGLGADFVGEKAKYKGFTPYLQSLTKQSIYWENHLSNSGESFAVLPNIVGSLPFGKEGFTNLERYTNRNTLYSLLRNNGYITSYNYGGNSAFNYMDKFLDEERVDRIIDKQDFGKNYILQEEDAAGFSLGYPDTELYKKFNANFFSTTKPRFDVLLTLSSKNPFLIPNQEEYIEKVENKLVKIDLDKRAKKIISKNKEIFASMLYSDTALQVFMESYKNKPEYQNTIFIITGSHNSTVLPHSNNLQRYKVPLFVYSPLQKKAKTISTLTSHADIAPSILSFLKVNYKITLPEQNAWLGSELISKSIFTSSKQIPLIKKRNAIVDYIKGSHFISKNKVYRLSEKLELMEEDNDDIFYEIKHSFSVFKSINNYVTKNNKIIPDSLSLYSKTAKELSKQDRIWVESVFNGKDYDNAYLTARDLAFNKDWDRSLLLCNYILSKIPRHSDTEILVGRLHAWKKDYTTSMHLLEEVVRKYPTYDDAYSALLDTYFWSNENERVVELKEKIRENNISSKEVNEKLLRAKVQLLNNKEIVETQF